MVYSSALKLCIILRQKFNVTFSSSLNINKQKKKKKKKKQNKETKKKDTPQF